MKNRKKNQMFVDHVMDKGVYNGSTNRRSSILGIGHCYISDHETNGLWCMMTLSDLKRQYRKLYVDILENEQRRGFTSKKLMKKLNDIKHLIQEGKNNGKKL